MAATIRSRELMVAMSMVPESPMLQAKLASSYSDLYGTPATVEVMSGHAILEVEGASKSLCKQIITEQLDQGQVVKADVNGPSPQTATYPMSELTTLSMQNGAQFHCHAGRNSVSLRFARLGP